MRVFYYKLTKISKIDILRSTYKTCHNNRLVEKKAYLCIIPVKIKELNVKRRFYRRLELLQTLRPTTNEIRHTLSGPSSWRQCTRLTINLQVKAVICVACKRTRSGFVKTSTPFHLFHIILHSCQKPIPSHVHL